MSTSPISRLLQPIRSPAVANLFYPGDPGVLRAQVKSYIIGTPPTGAVKAAILPHAGYIYSGSIAGSGYAGWRDSGRVRRVILLGPSHRVPFKGLALSSARGFATPLGTVPLDQETSKSLVKLPQVMLLDSAHSQEHSLEVHLPFLQVVFPEFVCVPLVVGIASPEDIAEVLEQLWGGPETVIVVSSDLSHFYSAEQAARLDAKTAQDLERLVNLSEGQACGRYPINGLLEIARRRGMRCQLVDLRNSSDTAGPPEKVVGYGAFWFFESSPK